MAAITESWTLFYVTLASHFLLFFGAPVVLFKLRWPVAGGLAMLLSTLLPIAGQTWFTDSDAPGLAFLLMLEFPLAVLILAVGICVSIHRWLQHRQLS